MQNFGVKLGALIDARELEHRAIARTALGARSTPESRQAFANYISRMRAGRVPNPGLIQLERLAKGMHLTLAEFFRALEPL